MAYQFHSLSSKTLFLSILGRYVARACTIIIVELLQATMPSSKILFCFISNISSCQFQNEMICNLDTLVLQPLVLKSGDQHSMLAVLLTVTQITESWQVITSEQHVQVCNSFEKSKERTCISACLYPCHLVLISEQCRG